MRLNGAGAPLAGLRERLARWPAGKEHHFSSRNAQLLEDVRRFVLVDIAGLQQVPSGSVGAQRALTFGVRLHTAGNLKA